MGRAEEIAPVVIAVVGATATGKSELSLDLAEAVGGEIINADAMQFYRGMDIGTAKLPVADRRSIPHHQIDTYEVTEDASVAAFQEAARADIDAIHRRGKRAIIVGGSGLYLRALLDRLEFQPTDPQVRARLEQRALDEGPGILHRELAVADPDAARKIEPRNAKRIVRALEVIEITGRPYTSSLPPREYFAPTIQVGLDTATDVLDKRIEQRVRRMWADGLVDETQRLVEAGLRKGTTARRAVGYAETLRFLDGEIDEPEAIELIARNTRRLARRQVRWFAPDSRIAWIAGVVTEHDAARVTTTALAAIATLVT